MSRHLVVSSPAILACPEDSGRTASGLRKTTGPSDEQSVKSEMHGFANIELEFIGWVTEGGLNFC